MLDRVWVHYTGFFLHRNSYRVYCVYCTGYAQQVIGKLNCVFSTGYGYVESGIFYRIWIDLKGHDMGMPFEGIDKVWVCHIGHACTQVCLVWEYPFSSCITSNQ